MCELFTKKNREDKEHPVRPRVSLRDCFEEFSLAEEVPNFYSSAIKARTIGLK